MSLASRVSAVHWSGISTFFEQLSWSLCEAVAPVEAELAEELDLLEVHDHVFDELKIGFETCEELNFHLEFSDHLLFLFSKLRSAHDVNVDGVELILEFSEEIVFSVFEDDLCGVESFEASTIS